MEKLPARTDVVISGAGPTGLSLAIALHQMGIAPLLLEKRDQPANTSRAGVIHARTLEMLEQLEVTPQLLAEGLQVTTFRMRDRDRVLMEVDFSHLKTRYPFTLMCPQDRTEALLRDRLAELGGTITRGAEVASVDQSRDGVRLSVKTGEDAQTISAAWLIACDGAHSTVRETAGIAFEGGNYEQVFALADVHMSWPLPRNEVTLFLSADGLVVIAPLPGDRFRIVATVDQSPAEPDAPFVQALLSQRGPEGDASEVHDVIWSSRFHVAHKMASQIVKDRIILCGDAAHVHSPAGGQGMNTGIQDAISLAAPLAEALRRSDAAGLANWSDNRRKIAHDVITLTDRMTRAASLQSGPAQAVRNAALTIAGHVPGVPSAIARKLAGLDRV